MKVFAWIFLFPMGVYWMMFVFFNWDAVEAKDFFEKTTFAMVKQGMMFFAGLHFYFWYRWKDGSGSGKTSPVSSARQ